MLTALLAAALLVQSASVVDSFCLTVGGLVLLTSGATAEQPGHQPTSAVLTDPRMYPVSGGLWPEQPLNIVQRPRTAYELADGTAAIWLLNAKLAPLFDGRSRSIVESVEPRKIIPVQRPPVVDDLATRAGMTTVAFIPGQKVIGPDGVTVTAPKKWIGWDGKPVQLTIERIAPDHLPVPIEAGINLLAPIYNIYADRIILAEEDQSFKIDIPFKGGYRFGVSAYTLYDDLLNNYYNWTFNPTGIHSDTVYTFEVNGIATKGESIIRTIVFVGSAGVLPGRSVICPNRLREGGTTGESDPDPPGCQQRQQQRHSSRPEMEKRVFSACISSLGERRAFLRPPHRILAGGRSSGPLG